MLLVPLVWLDALGLNRYGGLFAFVHSIAVAALRDEQFNLNPNELFRRSGVVWNVSIKTQLRQDILTGPGPWLLSFVLTSAPLANSTSATSGFPLSAE